MRYFALCLLLWIAPFCFGQNENFKFAFVSDTHVGGSTGAEDLMRTVKDINANPSLDFVVVTGDITEFGSDDELTLAKAILDSLQKPWHVIPGNHDSNWSESGSNSFKTIFGAESFYFQHKGYAFLGTASGPNMRMGPGQVPREHLVWLDSTLSKLPDPKMPVIYLNHYPQDSALNNWYDALDRLKRNNVQLILCGHGHSNKALDFEKIPGVMGRSNLRAKEEIGGYNIVTISNGKASFEIKKPFSDSLTAWNEVTLTDHQFSKSTETFPRPTYAVNDQFKNVEMLWSYQDNSDIGSGVTLQKKVILCSDTKGVLFALNKKGKKIWEYKTNGKIYATPAASGSSVVVTSSDKNVYCVDVKNGKLKWKFTAEKPIVANPVIADGKMFTGGSDGHFRALDLETGELVWDFKDVKGFVVTKPLIYQGKIFFGCWANDFYALDMKTGALAWKWNNGAANRMFSPAAVYPVASGNRVFVVAPDRYMTALNVATGNVVWRKQIPTVRVRESIGLSSDSSLVFVKTMDGDIYGVSTKADSMELSWKAKLKLPYEISPTALVETNNILYVPSNSGMVCAIDRSSGETIWKHKVSNALISGITPVDKRTVLVTTMDGKIVMLQTR
ncbi:PQQ-binding-like beta-propeller repeat protein [Dyadobacter sp. CY351]|uniref:outer membrane protein assembly factor BamB family protein n=1 Tax=Dyadobacter sp. CY351 TaxID=2909337 RepID=UPI001F324B09|nr:PQQ-binding-like beta-propeller repeat protein [Dyadobacter sp. CY351]MCF2517486.1 PQQ-binding-like beta-propeller repeat protein [Dyadobacter sp. CY351]